jgi:hypothetical protein
MFKLFILLAAFWAIYVNAHAVATNPQRELQVGEIVIHEFDTAEVIEKSDEKTYLIKILNHLNTVITVDREELAIMDGCVDEVCVKDRMFDVGYLRYVKLRGFTYNSDFVVETSEGWNGFYQPFKNNLARASGCHSSASRKICVGDKVTDFTGDVMTVIGIHDGDKLVLRSNDGWNSYRTFVEENSVRLIND